MFNVLHWYMQIYNVLHWYIQVYNVLHPSCPNVKKIKSGQFIYSDDLSWVLYSLMHENVVMHVFLFKFAS